VAAGESYSWNADPFWSGSIWGRTNCTFNSEGLGICDTGDCGGNLQCNDNSEDVRAITKAEFEFLGGIAKPDVFRFVGGRLQSSIVGGSKLCPR
jgi:hypothetical protein